MRKKTGLKKGNDEYYYCRSYGCNKRFRTKVMANKHLIKEHFDENFILTKDYVYGYIDGEI